MKATLRSLALCLLLPQKPMIIPNTEAAISKELEIHPTCELVSSNRRSYDVVLTLLIPFTAKPVTT